MKPAKPSPARDDASGDVLPVMVPRLERGLVPVAPERVRRLRRHLLDSLRTLASRKGLTPNPDPPRQRENFANNVIATACTLCQGFCCRHGGENAYLDERAMSRVRNANPGVTAWGIIRLYTERISDRVIEDSCIFHGAQGCTLSAFLRSEICHKYFCYGLEQFLAHTEPAEPVPAEPVPAEPVPAEPVIVIAGEGPRIRRSRVIKP